LHRYYPQGVLYFFFGLLIWLILLLLVGGFNYGFAEELISLSRFLVDLCIVLPFWIIFDLIQLAASLGSFLSSKFFVVRFPRYQEKTFGCKSGCKTQPRGLCNRCEQFIDNSPLLVGSSWPLVRPVEERVHHTPENLREATKTCHLCSFL